MPTLDIRELTLNYAVEGGSLQALAPVNLQIVSSRMSSVGMRATYLAIAFFTYTSVTKAE